jgi:hypothetical protein
MVPAKRGALRLCVLAADGALSAIFGILFRKYSGIEIPFLKWSFSFCEIPHLRAGRMPVQFGIAKK